MRASSNKTFRNSSDCARLVSISFAKVLAVLTDAADFHAAMAAAIAASSEQTEMMRLMQPSRDLQFLKLVKQLFQLVLDRRFNGFVQ